MNIQTGKIMIFLGVLIIIAGIIVYFFHDKLHRIGRLSGDIRIVRENFTFYFPITTMIIVSIALTIISILIRRYLH